MNTFTFKTSTIKKIANKMPKLLKAWSKDWNDTDFVVNYENAEALWDKYHEDITSDMFYMLENEMYQYSYFDDAEIEGTADYCMYTEYEKIVKEAFLNQVGNYLKFTPKETNISHINIVLQLAEEMSKEEIKKTINELIKKL